ncbi:unnamed protein product [Porites evermanni]|uniref:Uncharacterized protein n=1 Tax=Porites evermanni TaxID=104178 RepID=A0ABN8SPQ9_9CNID|nr:unnamed protein product [Porites evermanni]
MRLEVSVLFVIFLWNQQFKVLKTEKLPRFYPFGGNEGDQSVERNDDGSSGEVPLSISFPYFDQNHKSLFVNTNGVISFLDQVSQFTPDSFPLGDNRRLVAPFWADVDTRVAGQVFYRETTDQALLQQASEDVQANFVDHRKFKANWLFIATWHEVAFYGAEGPYKNKRNTFQAVLISNGRHSFVIFTYNKLIWTTGRSTQSGGDSEGIGGIPAQAGFNAGDGFRYFNIPGSRTSQVLDLPNKSNVGVSGRWMFRIDNAKIEAAGCNTKGSLVVSPQSVMMLGGDNILLSGPCFQPSHHIICQFADGKLSNGSYIDENRASCTVPMLNITGRLSIKLSVNGGASFNFQGNLTIVSIIRDEPRVSRVASESWEEQKPVNITWDPVYLGKQNQTVDVQLVRFSMKDDDHVSFHSMFTLITEQLNTGEAHFVVPKKEGQGASGEKDRFTTLVTVRRTGNKSSFASAEWIWSDLFFWKSQEFANERCLYWYEKQPHHIIYTDDISLLHCPHTRAQALADRGRFTIDEYSNPVTADQLYCGVYYHGATLCFRTTSPSNQGTGQQCCYNEIGDLIVGPRNGGSLDRVHVEAGVPALSHFFHDIVPYWDCCMLSDNCKKYFEKRPSNDGAKYIPPRPATSYGDPHIVTLDHVEYTFNGYGEYQILHVTGPEFSLQGRMQPLITADGVKSNATVYKAFAMKEDGSDLIQVHINGRNEMEILVNGVVTEYAEQFMMDFNGVAILKCENTSKYSVMFNSGISVTVEKAEADILQIMMLVPPIFKGNTSGLMGFWDGNKDREFLLPDGVFLNINPSESRRLHYEFGQQWVTTGNISLFTYEEGKSHAFYFDANYVPTFLDEEELSFDDSALGLQARDVCGHNRQCMFDIHTTRRVNIGIASKQAVESFIEINIATQTQGYEARYRVKVTTCLIAAAIILVIFFLVRSRRRRPLTINEKSPSQEGKSTSDKLTVASPEDVEEDSSPQEVTAKK